MRHDKIAVQLAVRLQGGSDGQRLFDDRQGVLGPPDPDQRLALQPLRRGDPQASIAGRGPSQHQGPGRQAERRLRIDHHGRLGLGDRLIERRLAGLGNRSPRGGGEAQ